MKKRDSQGIPITDLWFIQKLCPRVTNHESRDTGHESPVTAPEVHYG